MQKWQSCQIRHTPLYLIFGDLQKQSPFCLQMGFLHVDINPLNKF